MDANLLVKGQLIEITVNETSNKDKDTDAKLITLKGEFLSLDSKGLNLKVDGKKTSRSMKKVIKIELQTEVDDTAPATGEFTKAQDLIDAAYRDGNISYAIWYGRTWRLRHRKMNVAMPEKKVLDEMRKLHNA